MASATTTLPLDIILDIIDFCCVSLNYIPDYRTLRALCLVSKQLTPHAQRLLYRNVFLWRESLARAFGASLNPHTHRGKWLSQRVYSLRAIVRSAESREGHGLSQQTFLAVICACPDLRELDVDPERGFDHRLFSVMRSHPSPVQTLRFHITDMAQYLLIALFPGLKYLQIKDTGRHRAPLHAQPPTCALRELHLRGDASAAEWILRGSYDTLEVLSLETPIVNFTAFRAILEKHGHGLRSLSVRMCGQELIPLLRNYCTRLEEFSYSAFPPATLLEALPRTLEHLQIIGSIGFGKPAMNDLLSYIQVAPSLLNLTYCLDRVASEDPFLLRWLSRTCEEYLIVFYYFAPSFGSFPGERIDFGPVRRFPRPMRLSPLRMRESTLEEQISEYTSD